MTGGFAQHYGALEYVDLDAPPSPDEFSPQEAAALAVIAAGVAAAGSLAQALDVVFEGSLDITPCDRLGLARVEDDGQRSVSAWVRATYGPLLLGVGYAETLAGSSLAALLQGHRLRVINDLAEYQRTRPDSRSTRLLLQEGVRARLTAPLRDGDRTVGLFFRSARRPHAYTEHEVRLHLAMAIPLTEAMKRWKNT